MNCKNMEADMLPYGGGGGTGQVSGGSDGGGGNQFARQLSIYSLKFDELQNTMGGLRTDYGSMNMDAFLKNVLPAEESQTLGTSFGNNEGIGNLQRQGSLTLPRTTSLKTVDEVWRDTYKDNGGGGTSGLNLSQRQTTLGEVTLEEFLIRAGVVKEDSQIAGRRESNGYSDKLLQSNGNTSLSLRFGRANEINTSMSSHRSMESSNPPHPNQSPNLAVSLNGVISSQQQQKNHQRQLFPKQPTTAHTLPLHFADNAQLVSQGTRDAIVQREDPTMNKGFVKGDGLDTGSMGTVSFGGEAVTVPRDQPSSDGFGRSNDDSPSLSPVSFVLSGGLRRMGYSGVVEKIVERRQRRMIKNRESAARSRARKQAYTMQLEAEVAKLKEENNELLKKQAEIIEVQKKEVRDLPTEISRTMKQQNAKKMFAKDED
ncbi:hypothetical protein IFM89_025031 [Coptis chinensis]|uniref:BZIP domain-containing protein n=1 Tax=Coptis chinensis TaxID=261450 RepID=A0A835HXV2_9MAGN|nr:hypothetical protein IFM89_025031 [Coptis chinensis]